MKTNLMIEQPCAGCGKPLLLENAWMEDGCPCNTPAGVNNLNLFRWKLLHDLQQKEHHKLAAAQDALAKYEQAAREGIPKEPTFLLEYFKLASSKTTALNDALNYLDKLVTVAIAQTIRADENEVDARRYRWLRLLPGNENALAALEATCKNPLTPEQFDAAIDAALKEQKT